MTAVDRATLFLFTLVMVWATYQAALRLLRCTYCGKIANHDEHCPWAGKQ